MTFGAGPGAVGIVEQCSEAALEAMDPPTHHLESQEHIERDLAVERMLARRQHGHAAPQLFDFVLELEIHAVSIEHVFDTCKRSPAGAGWRQWSVRR